MYLDKPLRAHTLFQAVCRTNRRWTNPHTGQEKHYGLVVDYVGLGNELAKAVAVRDTGAGKALPTEVDDLVALLREYVRITMDRFEDVDRSGTGYEQLYAAQERLRTTEDRERFAEEFLRAEGLFEFLWPDTRLRAVEDDYRWLARIYKSIAPTDAGDKLLWHRLGAKTAELIAERVTDVTIDAASLERVAIDAEVFDALRRLELLPHDSGNRPSEPPTVEEVLDTLEARLARKLAGPDTHPAWISLAERLEALRQERITSAHASVEFLKRLLDLATDLVEAEKAEAEGHLDELRVLDPDKGAVSQILEEYAPPGLPVAIELVVEKIDAIVRPIRGSGWQTSQPGDREMRRRLRLVLKDSGLPPSGDLFDKAYAYIREHY